MMKLNLVDRLRVLVFPAILGRNGRQPVFAAYEQMRLELIEQKVLDSSTLLLEYRPKKGA